MSASFRIAILGAGNVGGALGRIWSSRHQVTFGVPDPDKSRSKVPSDVAVAKNQEATADAAIVVLTVPWSAAEEAVRSCGDLDSKILIDCTNPLSADLQGLTVGCDNSAGELVAAWAPKARVVKAFNTIGAIRLGDAQFNQQAADGFYCGDDSDAKGVVKQLISETGLNPVDVGPLRNARLLEPLAMLWIDLAVNQRQGADHGFKLLRR